MKLMSLEEVYFKFERFLYKLIQSWKHKFEEEDLFQVAFLGMTKAFTAYNADKNILFMTYLATVVNNELKMFNRKEEKHVDVDSLDKPILSQKLDKENLSLIDLVADKTNYEDRSIFNVTYKEITAIIENLNERDKKIIKEFYFNNKTQKQIGEEIGLKQSYISRILKKIPNTIKNKYEGENKMFTKEPKITKAQLMEEAKILGTGREAIVAISKKYGLTERTIDTYLGKYGIRDKLNNAKPAATKDNTNKEINESKKEIPSNNKILQPLVLRGKVMEYRVQENSFSIKNLTGTTNLVLNANEIDDFIKELKALKEVM
ncbi:sigma-70 family RNA polymerase sigma factor [Clostridium botulinum]|nr:sigma-70 family RNA polymerase sigma factor [Clostridium botulinum]NFC60572.1 sigma-70 family RNA polymerase sigma factor [Clostridium botulinum]NFC68580.1 sigma-70 family RNA polymerase sigma factor [Clostridium botulinum]NFE37143.1 sigma-70 family RNA polymerase sigma factor [Clostridium botulinum]NFE40336.1 sigma-70 family RNA polymerase sigma factor [Clostridium botulinum]